MKHLFLTALLVAVLGIKTIVAEPFVIAVMDPLAKELACACIDGFAQRDYKALANHLKKMDEARFGNVELVFAGSLPAALQKSSQKRVDMIIGKDSVVRDQLQKANIAATGIARLTDKKGSTNFTGLVIVAADDPAQSVADLKNHKLLLGPPDSTEKHAAAIKLFEKHGIAVPEKPETIGKCTEAGFAILENESEQPIAAVVSDYALALIVGCDLIEKGALRVIDKTEDVPFIGVFVPASVDKQVVEKLYTALLACKRDSKLLVALESKEGFVPYRTSDNANGDNVKDAWEEFPVKKAEGNSKN